MNLITVCFLHGRYEGECAKCIAMRQAPPPIDWPARVKELEDELAEIRLASGALPGVPTLAQVACMLEDNVAQFARVEELEALLAEVPEHIGQLSSGGNPQVFELFDRIRKTLGAKEEDEGTTGDPHAR